MDPFSPIQSLVDWLVFGVLHLAKTSPLGSALDFFLFDSTKIVLLLVIIILGVSLLRTFLPPEKVRASLAKMPRFLAHVSAAALGIVTPFCSCSAVPLFLGFVESGVPLGVTFSFLVASPMINEVALVMLLGLFGWQVALLYIGSGLVVAILAGLVLGKLKVEKLLQEFVLKNLNHGVRQQALLKMSWGDRWSYAVNYVLEILGKVWLWVLIGVGIGAWIHGYVPTDFLAQWASKDKWYAVPLAVLIGIPLYSNAAGVLPLVGALTEKGVSMGTALAFMMAVTALSFPEFMILRKVMKVRLLLVFAGVVGIGIIITGYLFNAVLP
ncbi:MAG: permease [Spirochaetales bacterium]|nr:permease [Spirochaetales bacterium]